MRRFEGEKRDSFVVEEANASADLEFQYEFPPNPDCAGIHVNRTLISEMIVVYDSLAQASRGGIFDPVAPEWVKKMFSLQGIEKVPLNPHEISFVKGRMYRWDDILPAAIEIMRQHFASEMKAQMTKQPHRWHLNSSGRQIDDFDLGDHSSIN